MSSKQRPAVRRLRIAVAVLLSFMLAIQGSPWRVALSETLAAGNAVAEGELPADGLQPEDGQPSDGQPPADGLPPEDSQPSSGQPFADESPADNAQPEDGQPSSDELPSGELPIDDLLAEEPQPDAAPLRLFSAQPMLLSTVDDVALRNTFTLENVPPEGVAYARRTVVHFVDSGGAHLNAMVPSKVVYDVGEELDLYGLYADALDPAIAAEYDYARTYVALKNDQKNFQRMQLNTTTAVGDGGSGYRIYMYMDDLGECRVGGVYRGTWYTLNTNAATNDVYLVFDHVSNPYFYAKDEGGYAVEGAEFTLYSDENCYTEFEYRGHTVTATSDAGGLVALGKLPYGTYYMKETNVPAGYKDHGTIYQLTVGANWKLADVVHEDDDGSVILSGIKAATITSDWKGAASHAGDTIEVTLTVPGQESSAQTVTLTSGNDWTQGVPNLDHTKSYIVSESKVLVGGSDVTGEWIPQIETNVKEREIDYFRADKLLRTRRYVVTTADGQALRGDGAGLGVSAVALGDEALAADAAITDDLLWEVESITDDGVVTLKNAATGAYLNYASGSWKLTGTPSVFVRNAVATTGGTINLYYRENTNNSAATYLTIGGGTIGTATKPNEATPFRIYQQTEVRSVEVIVKNRQTVCPIQIRNMAYPGETPLAGMSYGLYDEKNELRTALTADAEGYLTPAGTAGVTLDLAAGSYYLRQTSSLAGYQPHTKNVAFTLTRGGVLRMRTADRELPEYEYVAADGSQAGAVPLLRIPNQKLAKLGVAKQTDGNLGAGTDFSFGVTLRTASGLALADWQLADGLTTDANGEATFMLAGNASREFTVPVGAQLAVEETSTGYVTTVGDGSGTGFVRGSSFEVAAVPDEGCSVTFHNARAVCKVVHDGTEVPFTTLGDALDYIRAEMPGQQVVIQMLVDYAMPASDAVSLVQGDDVTITTAGGEGVFRYGGSGAQATIAEGSGFSNVPMITVGDGSTLRLTDIAIARGMGAAAGVYASAGGTVELSGTVVVAGAGEKNLYLAKGFSAERLRVTGNLADGSQVKVWAEDESLDGADLLSDEQFGVTAAAGVAGLQRIASERGGVTATAGEGNQVIWAASPVVEITFREEGEYADNTDQFGFVVTLPDGVERIEAAVNGVDRAFTRESNTVNLSNGDKLVMKNLTSSSSFTLTQTHKWILPKPVYGTASYNPRVSQDTESTRGTAKVAMQADDARVVTISAIAASAEQPAKVTITNTFSIDGVLPTGIADETAPWIVVVVSCTLLLCWQLTRRLRA